MFSEGVVAGDAVEKGCGVHWYSRPNEFKGFGP
jgi:hypothetical protein